MKWLVLKEEFVRSSLDYLFERAIHPHLNGYLCLLRESAREGRDEDLRMPAKAFFEEFWRVDDAPLKKPYLLPFAEKPGKPASVWFNSNVAGSYAPSSLRQRALLKVISVTGEGTAALFALKPGHPTLALANLLYGEPLDPFKLGAVLYRDYGFQLRKGGPNPVIACLRNEFGLDRDGGHENIFSTLFDQSDVDELAERAFEEIEV